MMIRAKHAAILVGIAIGLGTDAVLASGPHINYLTQQRSVTAVAHDWWNDIHLSASETATDFGRFNVGLSLDLPYGPGSGGAGQDSTLDPYTGITMALGASGFGSPNYQQAAGGSSSFNVEFEILEPVMATVTLNWWDGTCMLFGPDLDLGIDPLTQQTFGPAPVLLRPGVYLMTGYVSHIATSGGSGVMVSGSVIVPSAGGLPALVAIGALTLRCRRDDKR